MKANFLVSSSGYLIISGSVYRVLYFLPDSFKFGFLLETKSNVENDLPIPKITLRNDIHAII